MSGAPQQLGERTCAACGALSPAGKRFCGDCGAPMGPAPIDVRAEIRTALKEQVKDQKLVELEIAQSVAGKLSEWAKLLGFFIGLPLAALALVLGSLGIKSYVDFTSKVEKAGAEVDANLKQAQQKAGTIRQQADQLSEDYAALSRQLADTKQLSAQYKDLASKVQQIGRKVGIEFQASPSLDSSRRAAMQAALDGFQAYLERLGYRQKQPRIGISVKPGVGANAFYDAEHDQLVLGEGALDDQDAVLHTYFAHVAGSSFPKMPGGEIAEYGLLDYFVCSYTNDPLLGERMAKSLGKAYLRNLKNERPIGSTTVTWGNPGAEEQAEEWGGLFWDIRTLLGQAAGDRLIFSTRTGWKNGKAFQKDEFARAMLEQAKAIGLGDSLEAIRKACERRGLRP